MGLNLSTTQYHLALTKLLSAQLSSNLVALYPDDCALFTKRVDFDRHLEYLDQILDEYCSVHSHINAAKTTLLAPKVKY